MSLHIGEAGITEPMWVYLAFMRRSLHEQKFVEHDIGAREITGLTLTSPLPLQSPASQIVIESGILTPRSGPESLLEIEFDRARQKRLVDLRPDLPFIFRL
jgi:hypothetical protein